MKNEFLHKEYELNYEQLRFYDSRQSSIFRYLFTLTSSVATAQFALYKFFQTPTQSYFRCHLFLSSIVFIATLLLFLAMLQNRLYFVFTARQLNAIRGYLLEKEASEFQNNQLYTSVDFPAIKLSSVHTLQLVGASFISSMFAASAMYAFMPALKETPSLGWSIFTFMIIVAAEIGFGYKYLDEQGKRTSDKAIHEK